MFYSAPYGKHLNVVCQTGCESIHESRVRENAKMIDAKRLLDQLVSSGVAGGMAGGLAGGALAQSLSGKMRCRRPMTTILNDPS